MAIIAPIEEGTVLLDGSEQTIVEGAGYEPVSISLDFVSNAAGDIVIIRIYKKVRSTGAYRLLSATTIEDALTETAYDSVYINGHYGYKFTLEQTAGVAYNVPYSLCKAV